MAKAKREHDWFDEWTVTPWGVGGDVLALRCPRGNPDRPDRTPECFIEMSHSGDTVGNLRAIARKHRARFH